ncbi:MAG: hypothetical protein IKK83_00350 [Clostridia bacterium]|nr:hypothetical protein [Clostridia bacterium]
MTLRISINKLRYALVFALLFFAAMNFKAKFFYFVFAALISLGILQRRLLINAGSLVYLALGVLMAVYNYDEGVLSMVRCLAPLSLYLVGYNITAIMEGKAQDFAFDEDAAKRTGYFLLISISAGSFFHYILNFATNYNKFLGRNTIDIWTGSVMAATGQATLACLMLGLSVAMIFAPKKRSHRWIGAISIVCMIAYNLVLAGRTLFVVLLVLFAVAILYMRKSLTTKGGKLKLFIGCIMTVLSLAVAYFYNLFGLRSYISQSNFFNRFGASLDMFAEDSSRASSKWAFIVNSLEYPFGGLKLREQYGYAHDLLLDGYDEYGLFGFLLLVSVLALGVWELYKFLRFTSYSHELKLAYLCVYVSVLLIFCVEPILAGMPWLFACYCLINGCLTGMNMAHFSKKQ